MLQRRDDTEFWQSVSPAAWNRMSRRRMPRGVKSWKKSASISKQSTCRCSDCQRCVEFELFVHLRHRYAPGTTRNKEHWFCLALPRRDPVITEHHAYQWLEAAGP